MASSTTTTRVRETATASGSASDQRAQAIRLPEDAARLTAPLELRDGATLTMRAIRADNTQRLRPFHAHLSLETIYLRFFTPLMELPPVMAERLTHVDYKNRMALVATTGAGKDEQIVSIVHHDRAGPAVGEVAFVVAHDWQGRGVATALLQRLAEYARARLRATGCTNDGMEQLHALAAAALRLPVGVVLCRRTVGRDAGYFATARACLRCVTGTLQ